MSMTWLRWWSVRAGESVAVKPMVVIYMTVNVICSGNASRLGDKEKEVGESAGSIFPCHSPDSIMGKLLSARDKAF